MSIEHRQPLGSAERRPRFVFQGWLILCPAFLLAAYGFWSLREDRILAEVEAVDQARELADHLTREVLPEAIRLPAVFLEDLTRFRRVPSAPEEDLVWQFSRLPLARMAYRVDRQGRLLYPPVSRFLGGSTGVTVGAGEETLEALWKASQRALFVERDPELARSSLDRFLTNSVPRTWAARAVHALGVLALEAGDEAEAIRHFQRVVQDFEGVESPSGLPASVLAELQLLRLTPPGTNGAMAERSDWIVDLAAQAVRHPTPLSAFLLDEAQVRAAQESARAEDSVALVEGWRGVWFTHEMARAWFGLWEETRMPTAGAAFIPAAAEWIRLQTGSAWLVTRLTDGEAWWCFAVAETDLRQIAEAALARQSTPDYLRCSLRFTGLDSEEAPGGEPPLATVKTDPDAALMIPGTRLDVWLSDPEALYARQRTRTLWLGGLIGLSLGAVLVGFGAARQAFRRQQSLSEMKTNFVSSVSHELRAPIASVRLMAEELSDAEANPGKARQYHRFIVRECQRLSGLIENVLDFARHDQGRRQYEFEPTDVVALVEETAQTMNAYGAEREVSVLAQVPPGALTGEMDGRAMQQVLVNLLDNALKHSPPGSTVIIGLERRESNDTSTTGPTVSGQASAPGAVRPGELRLWVEDSGEGIPKDEQSRVFERFYRRGSELRRETPGVGLGLAIARLTVEAHGGRIELRSRPGEGSRFTVVLPWTPEDGG